MSDANLKTRLLTIIVREIPNKKKGIRADAILAGLEGLPSRSQLKHWFEEGRIRRNGKILSASDSLELGDKIEIDPPLPKPLKLEPRKIPIHILYEDEFLIVLFKPRDLSMHPGASRDDQNTLVHALLYHSKSLSDSGGEFRPGIVHRLDKDTEGLVVIAKDNKTHEALSKQFSDRSIDRAYWALCFGKPPTKFEVDKPIGRHPKDRKKMAVHEKGRSAKTSFECLKSFNAGYSWLRCKLHTGRTHQIRVHLAYKGPPVLNDPVYARSNAKLKLSDEQAECLKNLKGQCLIAYQLGFIHPATGEKMFFEAEMPDWLKLFVEAS